MCPPVSPHKGASIVKFPAHNACIFGMETPLCGRSGGHTGTAPTVSLERIARGCPPLRFSFEWITRGQIARGTVGVLWEGDMAIHYLFLF